MKHNFHIQLKNLPEQGLQFTFDKNNAQELTKKLQDLIEKNDYLIKIEIQATGELTYLVKGYIKTHLNLLCSRCAYEFQYPIDKNFSENLYIQEEQKRSDKESRINHYSEQIQDDDFTILSKSMFHLDDFIHELIAVEEPARPMPFPTCDQNDDCEHLQKVKATGIFNKNTSEDSSKPEKNTALQEQLKNLLKD